MTAKRVGMFFYADAWRSDSGLAICSEGSRLLWFEILLVMNEADQRGFLTVNGRAPTPRQIAALTRTDPAKVEERLTELEEAGVFSRDRRGVIYSRRMVADEKKARTARDNGKMGGNPSLRKQRANSSSDNPPDNGSDKPLNSELLAPSSDTESLSSSSGVSDPPRARTHEDGADAPAAAAESPAPPAVAHPPAGAGAGADDPLRCEPLASLIDETADRLAVTGGTRRQIERTVSIWLATVPPGIAAQALGKGLDRAHGDPLAYAGRIVASHSTELTVARETAANPPRREDPIFMAERMTLAVLEQMEEQRDADFCAAHHVLAH